MRLPTIRRLSNGQRPYDLYWKFAAERHAIFERRLRGEERPWTSDRILQKFKFCNTFRAVDRVSQWGLQQVCYSDWEARQNKGDSYKLDDAERLFHIVAFRLFSRPETWGGLRAFIGEPRIRDLENGRFLHGLNEVKKRDGKLYTNAFILCANNAFGVDSKHANHAALLKSMFCNKDKDFVAQILTADSLETVYDTLHGYPLLGDFMSYQIAIDINYSELVNFSENDFTKPGPGALRGLKKCFANLGDFTPEQTIQWMVDRQDEEFERLGLEFNGLFGRKLHAIDAQGLFCETDKYCREAVPELASERSRIKAKYVQDQAPYRIFLPPKWGLDCESAYIHKATGPEQSKVEEWL